MCRTCWQMAIELAQWDAEYINKLPDAAFAVIEPDYKRGKTTNKNARHLPHHSDGVKDGNSSSDHIDLPHLRNALARVSQITPVTGSIQKQDLIDRATSHLQKHAKDLKIGDKGSGSGKAEKPRTERQSLSLAMPEAAVISRLASLGIQLPSPGAAVMNLEGSILSVDSSNLNIEKIGKRLAAQKEIREAMPRFSADGGPDVTIADIVPSAEDYITASCRALSKVIIPDRFIDFTQGDILKKSAGMLKGATLYPNHRAFVENWLGVVTKSFWDEENNPPGINADIKVDALANPRIARGMLMDPPALSRYSVTIFSEWEKSHSDLEDREFFDLLGSNVDGQMVRFIITKIKGYGELSLVWFGADWGAKAIGKPKIGS